MKVRTSDRPESAPPPLTARRKRVASVVGGMTAGLPVLLLPLPPPPPPSLVPPSHSHTLHVTRKHTKTLSCPLNSLKYGGKIYATIQWCGFLSFSVPLLADQHKAPPKRAGRTAPEASRGASEKAGKPLNAPRFMGPQRGQRGNGSNVLPTISSHCPRVPLPSPPLSSPRHGNTAQGR